MCRKREILSELIMQRHVGGIGDVGGLSPAFTLLQLDLIPRITHQQLEVFCQPMNSSNCKDLGDIDPLFLRFWREAVPFPRRFPLSHLFINQKALGLTRIQTSGARRYTKSQLIKTIISISICMIYLNSFLC